MEAISLEIPKRVKNLIGLSYGDLIIMRYLGTIESAKSCHVANWLCKCSCGELCERSSFTLNQSKKKGYVSMCRSCANLKLKKGKPDEANA